MRCKFKAVLPNSLYLIPSRIDEREILKKASVKAEMTFRPNYTFYFSRNLFLNLASHGKRNDRCCIVFFQIEQRLPGKSYCIQEVQLPCTSPLPDFQTVPTGHDRQPLLSGS